VSVNESCVGSSRGTFPACLAIPACRPGRFPPPCVVLELRGRGRIHFPALRQEFCPGARARLEHRRGSGRGIHRLSVGDALFWRTRRSGLLFAASLTLFLAALTRPEGVLVAGVLLGISGLVSLLQDRALLKPIAAATLAFSVLFAAYWMWRASYFGYPFPNTF